MTFLCRQAFAKQFDSTPDDLDMAVSSGSSSTIVPEMAVRVAVGVVLSYSTWQSSAASCQQPCNPMYPGCNPMYFLARSSTTCRTTSQRWRSTWSTAGPAACSCTARGARAPSRRTILSSRWPISSQASPCSWGAPCPHGVPMVTEQVRSTCPLNLSLNLSDIVVGSK